MAVEECGTWQGASVCWREEKGYALAWGDVYLGKIDDVRSSSQNAATRVRPLAAKAPAPSFQLWDTGVVPYVIDGSVPSDVVAHILGSLNELSANVPGLRFVARSAEPTYVKLLVDPQRGGCRAGLGRQPGENLVWLMAVESRPDWMASCFNHELGHRLGLAHEHQRPDRDQFVLVHDDKLVPGNESAFSRLDWIVPLTPYDYLSTMHYGWGNGGKVAGDVVISRLDGTTAPLGESNPKYFSETDYAALRAMYPAARYAPLYRYYRQVRDPNPTDPNVYWITDHFLGSEPGFPEQRGWVSESGQPPQVYFFVHTGTRIPQGEGQRHRLECEAGRTELLKYRTVEQIPNLNGVYDARTYLFTTNPRDPALSEAAYQLGNVVGCIDLAPQPGQVPLYRLEKPGRYTEPYRVLLDPRRRAELLAQGWRDGGIVGYVYTTLPSL